MTEAKSLGYKIGLHTSGIAPDRLRRVLPLLDWVGFENYTRFVTSSSFWPSIYATLVIVGLFATVINFARFCAQELQPRQPMVTLFLLELHLQLMLVKFSSQNVID